MSHHIAPDSVVVASRIERIKHDKVKRIAAADRRTVSNWIAIAIESALDQHDRRSAERSEASRQAHQR